MSYPPARIENAAFEVPEGLAARIWDRDATVWGPGDDDPADRLGWLDAPYEMAREVKALEDFAGDVHAEGIDSIALLGMGGSSLAPEVFAALGRHGPSTLEVFDSTHPAHVRVRTQALDTGRTLFVVSSKSGGTVETMSMYRHFRELVDDGGRFVAITDPGTSLERMAREEGFRATFVNPPDIGGRFSALSLFGLVPAALVGADLDDLLATARGMADACRQEGIANPGLALGCALASLARKGRDKLTFVISEPWPPFGDWVEQLIAESTGKRGTGIVPVVREPQAAPAFYGEDRAFVHLHVPREGDTDPIRPLAADGYPVVTIDVDGDAEGLGGEMFRWEFATAAAGAMLGINAFDQPDVEAAKRAARAALDSSEAVSWPEDDPDAVLARAAPGDLACVLVYAPPTEEAEATIAAARRKIVERHRIATSAGFGPRYLHSTGQLHKGGPERVRAVVVLDPPTLDVPIPGGPHGFARLVTAQALGDSRALEDAGRHVTRTTWRRFDEWARS